MNGTEAAVTLLLGLLDRAAAVGALITKARAEGRDVTADELAAAAAEDDTARAKLQAEIDRQRAG